MKTCVFIILFCFILIPLAYCGDLDDGIGLDDGIRTGNNDLQKMVNIRFYDAKVKGKVYKKVKNNRDVIIDGSQAVSSGTGGTNIASPNIKGNVRGDVIIKLEARDITVVH